MATTATPKYLAEIAERVRLNARCSLLSTLQNNNNWMFMSQLKYALRSIPEEVLDQVMQELEAEKIIVRYKGTRGSEKIAKAVRGNPLNPYFYGYEDGNSPHQCDDPGVTDAVKE